MEVSFPTNYSYNGLHSKKVWCEEMTEEQIMNPKLMSRTAIIGVRSMYDYADALLEMNDLFKRNGPTYEPRPKLQRQFGRLHIK